MNNNAKRQRQSKLLTIKELKDILHLSGRARTSSLLFCFGSSFISKLIQAKTRLYPGEKVPSHVALIYYGYVYESTTDAVKIGKKRIPAGVRRWLLEDFLKSELKKETLYYIYPWSKINLKTLEDNVHRPYGIDHILDFLFTDESDGDGDGLICSQYVNMAANVIKSPCPSPAELFRVVRLPGGTRS